MELRDIVAQLDSLKEQLEVLRSLKAADLNRLNQKIRLDWNFHSNSIEGNTLSQSETKSFILWGITAKGKPFRDYLEMRGHDEALKKLYELIHQDTVLTQSLIKELHKMILVEQYYDEKAEINPGEWKKIHNYLHSPTGERVDFESPADVPNLMSDLLNWVNNHISPPKRKKHKYDLHPLLIAAGFHIRFIQIHPFGDGNGRMARILTNLILMLCGYQPAIVPTKGRDDYFIAINNGSLENPEELAIYLGKAVIKSLELSIRAAKGESIEDPDDLDKQLAVLERKLKGEKIEKVKSEATLLEFSETTLIHIAQVFVRVHEKFSRFYIDTQFDIDEFSSPLFLRCKFLHFNRNQQGLFDYQTTLRITFEQTKFTLQIGDTQASYLYTKEFEDQELEEFLKIGAKEHLAFIEHKMQK